MLVDYDKVSPILSSIGTSDFGPSVLKTIETEFGVSHCMVFEQVKDSKPRCIIAEGNSFSQVRSQGEDPMKDWISKDFSVDPVMHFLRNHASDTPRIDKFDTLNFHLSNIPEQHQYIDRYVLSPQVVQEVTCSRKEGNRLLWVSVCRGANSSTLQPVQQQELECIARLILTCADRQVKFMNSAEIPATPDPKIAELKWASTRSGMLAKVQEALLQNSSILTQREAEICAHIVVGYQVLAISLNLNISVNTVATHRKRAYAKLGITSQTELFNNCLKHGLMN